MAIYYNTQTGAAVDIPARHPVPMDCTPIAPPAVAADQELHWYMGAWMVGPLPTVPVDEAVVLAEAKSAKIAAVNVACDAALAPLTMTYPDREVLSWPQQIAEATTLATDPTAAAPLLRQMAAERPSLGETPEGRVAELARRILANAAAWSAVAGPVLGKRQALEDAVNACTTPETVAAIVIDLGGAA